MCCNPMIFAAMALAGALYMLGRWCAVHPMRPPWRLVTVVSALLLCVPSALVIVQYLHLIGEPLWYIEFRALPGTEITPALSAAFFGYISRPWQRALAKYPTVFFRTPALLCAAFALPAFIKPLLLPLQTGRLQDRWKDGVCMQTSPSTCGPASLATIYGCYVLPRTEREIAQGAYSTASGTELWYLLRYARQHGLRATLCPGKPLEQVRPPALLGTRPNNQYGHYVVLLGRDGETRTIGDPMRGRDTMPRARFDAFYGHGGCVIEFSRRP